MKKQSIMHQLTSGNHEHLSCVLVVFSQGNIGPSYSFQFSMGQYFATPLGSVDILPSVAEGYLVVQIVFGTLYKRIFWEMCASL